MFIVLLFNMLLSFLPLTVAAGDINVCCQENTYGGIIADISTDRNVQSRLYNIMSSTGAVCCDPTDIVWRRSAHEKAEGGNGKELDRTNNLFWYDFLARPYDPTRGQFTNPDQKAEEYYPWNQYTFCGNNPIKYVDPDGREIWIYYINEKGIVQSFQYSIEMKCPVNNEIAATLISNLNNLAAHPDGNNVINEIIKSSKKYGYTQADVGSVYKDAKGYYDNLSNTAYLDNVNNTLAFAEETFHIYQYVKNQGGTTAANEVDAKLFSYKMNLEIEGWDDVEAADEIAGTPNYFDRMQKLLFYGFNFDDYSYAIKSFFSDSKSGASYKKIKGYTSGIIRRNPLIKSFLPIK